MRARGGVWICGVAVCGLVMSACAPIPRSPAIAESPPFSVVERRQAFTLPAAIRHVVVHNRHGDVRIRWSDRREIGLYATVQRIGAQPLEPSFQTAQNDDRYTLDVRFPGDQAWAAGDHRRGRVDLGIWLPADMRVDVETSDGQVQVRRARQPVRVRTVGGNIELSVHGDVDAESVSGNITVRQLSGQWNGIARAVTGTGNILAAIPAFADLQVDAQSGGTLSVDPGLPPAHPVAPSGMTLQASFGAATHLLQLRAGGDLHIVPVIRLAQRKN